MPDDDFVRFQNKPATHSVQIAAALEVERSAELRVKLAAKNVECQALRARAETDRYRHQMRLDDMGKQLALREAETARLKRVLEQLMAETLEYTEHAERRGSPAPDPVVVAADAAEVAELRGQLQSAREEYERLRTAMDNSVALKLARSVGRLLGMGARQ